MDSSHEIPVLFYVFAFVAIAVFLYNCRRFLVVRIGREVTALASPVSRVTERSVSSLPIRTTRKRRQL